MTDLETRYDPFGIQVLWPTCVHKDPSVFKHIQTQSKQYRVRVVYAPYMPLRLDQPSFLMANLYIFCQTPHVIMSIIYIVKHLPSRHIYFVQLITLFLDTK